MPKRLYFSLNKLRNETCHKIAHYKWPLIRSPNELVEQNGALPDDPGRPGLLVLTATECDAVVHSALLVQDDLFLLHEANALLADLVRLKL